MALLPTERRSYNDDVRAEAYVPAEVAITDKQRNGIRENFDTCSSMRDHVHGALRGVLLLSAETPLPQDTVEAGEFTRAPRRNS